MHTIHTGHSECNGHYRWLSQLNAKLLTKSLNFLRFTFQVGPHFYNVRLLKCFHEDSTSYSLSQTSQSMPFWQHLVRACYELLHIDTCSKPLILYGFSYNFPGFSSTRTYYSSSIIIVYTTLINYTKMAAATKSNSTCGIG